MTPDILIAIILFTLTLLAYCLLMPAIRIRRGKYGPWPIRVLVVSILVNCLCQVYLLLHGHITCTLIFISLNAVEALIIGLITESAASTARAMAQMEKKFGKKRSGEEGEPVFRQYIQMNNIIDSLQLDSGVEIAELSNDRFRVIIEVIGVVRVLWSPDPKTTPRQAYDTPSQFPAKLKEIIANELEGKETNTPIVEDSNWFEIVIEDKKDKNIIDTYETYPEQMTSEQIEMCLWEAWSKYCNKEGKDS